MSHHYYTPGADTHTWLNVLMHCRALKRTSTAVMNDDLGLDSGIGPCYGQISKYFGLSKKVRISGDSEFQGLRI